MLVPVRSRFKRFRRDDRANSTVEFVLIFPLFVLIFSSGFEAGLLSVRQTMLERATSMAVRDVQLATSNPPSFDMLKANICDYAGIIPDCTAALNLELVRVNMQTFDLPDSRVGCIDRDDEIEPATVFTPGQSNELMLVRACAVFEPSFPTTGLGLRLPKVNATDYALVAASFYVAEPG